MTMLKTGVMGIDMMTMKALNAQPQTMGLRMAGHMIPHVAGLGNLALATDENAWRSVSGVIQSMSESSFIPNVSDLSGGLESYKGIGGALDVGRDLWTGIVGDVAKVGTAGAKSFSNDWRGKALKAIGEPLGGLADKVQWAFWSAPAMFAGDTYDSYKDWKAQRADANTAGKQQAEARSAFEQGDLSKMGVKDEQGLIHSLMLAGAGSDAEYLGRFVANYMSNTGLKTEDLLKNPEHLKTLYKMGMTAVREEVSSSGFSQGIFQIMDSLGISPMHSAAGPIMDGMSDASTADLNRLSIGSAYYGAIDPAKLGSIPMAARPDFAMTTGALGIEYGSRKMGMVLEMLAPSSPYTFNLALQQGTITPAQIEAEYGIQGIAPTMDLKTGLAANQEELWSLDRKGITLSREHRDREARIAWGTPGKMGGYYAGNTGGVYTPAVPAVMGEVQQRNQYNLDMLNMRHGHAMADMDWNIGLIQSGLGRSMAMANAQFGITQKGWEFQEQQFGFNRINFAMNVRHGDERYAMQLGHIDRNLGMQLAERGLQRNIMMTQYRQQDEELAIQGERRPITWQWRFEDMAFQGEQSGLEFGWRQEDYRRNIRLATGRQKIGLRREMERDQIRYGMGEDQRGRQEERLKQQKEWEDEDFERKKSHYEEVKELQIALFDMQTAHMIEQVGMQKESLALSQRQAKEGQVMQSVQMTAAEQNFQTMKDLQTELHNLQMTHMQEAAAEQIASIERNRTQAQELKDATEAQMVLEAEQDADRQKRLEKYWEDADKLEDDRYASVVNQAKAVGAMNAFFVSWRDEILPDIKTLAEEIARILKDAQNGGGTPPPPPPPPDPDAPPIGPEPPDVGAAPPPTWYTPPASSTPETPETPPASPWYSPYGSSESRTSTRSVEEVAEDLAQLLLDTNSADRWLNGKYSRNQRR